jgi:hypothetical protein
MSRNHHVYPELDRSVNLIVCTKSPQKWLLIDRETGQSYVGNESGAWDKLIPKIKEDKK